MRVLVTGPGGLVGRRFVDLLSQKSSPDLCVLTRYPQNWRGPGWAIPVPLELLSNGESGRIRPNYLEGIHTVVHLAGINASRHKQNEGLYILGNSKFTENLGRASAEAGVRRFIFVSSIKVHGERTISRPFMVSDQLKPQDAYANSKLRAERALIAISDKSGMELVIVRPPLVVGRGAKGNIKFLAKAISLGVPLPFGGVSKNRRSIVGVSDLSDLLVRLLAAGTGAAGTYLVRSATMSTASLISTLSQHIGVQPRMFNVPSLAFKVAGSVLRVSDLISRLVDDLEVDDQLTRSSLDWAPPFGLEFECQDIAKDYKYFANPL